MERGRIFLCLSIRYGKLSILRLLPRFPFRSDRKNEIFLCKTAAVGILHKQNNDMHCKNALLPVCKCSVCIKSGIILFVKKWGNSKGMEITVDSNSQNVL